MATGASQVLPRWAPCCHCTVEQSAVYALREDQTTRVWSCYAGRQNHDRHPGLSSSHRRSVLFQFSRELLFRQRSSSFPTAGKASRRSLSGHCLTFCHPAKVVGRNSWLKNTFIKISFKVGRPRDIDISTEGVRCLKILHYCRLHAPSHCTQLCHLHSATQWPPASIISRCRGRCQRPPAPATSLLTAMPSFCPLLLGFELLRVLPNVFPASVVSICFWSPSVFGPSVFHSTLKTLKTLKTLPFLLWNIPICWYTPGPDKKPIND